MVMNRMFENEATELLYITANLFDLILIRHTYRNGRKKITNIISIPFYPVNLSRIVRCYNYVLIQTS